MQQTSEDCGLVAIDLHFYELYRETWRVLTLDLSEGTINLLLAAKVLRQPLNKNYRVHYNRPQLVINIMQNGEPFAVGDRYPSREGREQNQDQLKTIKNILRELGKTDQEIHMLFESAQALKERPP